jgi:regulator of replication initiation timing
MLTQISQHLASLPHFFEIVNGIMAGRGLPRVCKRCWRPFETPQACEKHKPTCERPTRQPSQWQKWSVYRQAFGEDGSALRTTLPSILWGQSDVADLAQAAEAIRELKKEIQSLKGRLQSSEENLQALQMENRYLKNLQASEEEINRALYSQHQMSTVIRADPAKHIQHVTAQHGKFSLDTCNSCSTTCIRVGHSDATTREDVRPNNRREILYNL